MNKQIIVILTGLILGSASYSQNYVNERACISSGGGTAVTGSYNNIAVINILTAGESISAGYAHQAGILNGLDWYTFVNSTALLPTEFKLFQNYPNPFNPSTSIAFSLPEPANVIIEVYDLLGRKIDTLASSHYEAGKHALIWHADSRSSGVYFYKIVAGNYSQTKKMMLIR